MQYLDAINSRCGTIMSRGRGEGEIRKGWNEIKSIHITHQAEFQENVSLHQQNQS